MTNEGSIISENSKYMFFSAWCFLLVVLFAVELLINFRSPGGPIDLVSPYRARKLNFIHNFKINNNSSRHIDDFASQYLYTSNFDGKIFCLELSSLTLTAFRIFNP